MRNLAIIVCSTAFLLGACAEPDDDGDGVVRDIEDATEQGLNDFLDARGFEDWTSEPEPRDPILGSPHGLVRTYFGPQLEESLNDFDGQHPVGAAAVKEVYSDPDTRSHYFVYVRDREGTIDEGYTWFRQGGQGDLYIESGGFCADCHANTDGNIDGTLTPYPP